MGSRYKFYANTENSKRVLRLICSWGMVRGEERNDLMGPGGVRCRVRSGHPREGHQGPHSDLLQLLQRKTLLSCQNYPLALFSMVQNYKLSFSGKKRLSVVTP